MLDRRVNAHGLSVQLDQPRLHSLPLSLARMLFHCPRDLDTAPGVLALTYVRSGIVPTMRTFEEADCPPIEVELRRVALAPPRESSQTPAPALYITALADVQQARLAPCPEPVDARRRRDHFAAVGLIEVLPLRPRQPTHSAA